MRFADLSFTNASNYSCIFSPQQLSRAPAAYGWSHPALNLRFERWLFTDLKRGKLVARALEASKSDPSVVIVWSMSRYEFYRRRNGKFNCKASVQWYVIELTNMELLFQENGTYARQPKLETVFLSHIKEIVFFPMGYIFLLLLQDVS